MLRMTYIIRLIIILIITVVMPSCDYSENQIKIDNWEILYEQDRELSRIIKKDEWRSILIPATLNLPNTEIKDFRYVWLRSSFEIKDNPGRYYGISIGKVVLYEETYLNSVPIGKTSKKRINWSPLTRHYVIPEMTLRKGQNDIYIRLGIYGNSMGGILNDIYIQDEVSYYLFETFDNLIAEQLPIGIGE